MLEVYTTLMSPSMQFLVEFKSYLKHFIFAAVMGKLMRCIICLVALLDLPFEPSPYSPQNKLLFGRVSALECHCYSKCDMNLLMPNSSTFLFAGFSRSSRARVMFDI